MSRNSFALAAIAVMTAVTLFTRAAPFLIFGRGRKTPPVILYLGRVLPPAVMAMLVVYCLKGMSFASLSGWLPIVLASLLTAGLHLWKRSTLLSIFGGTLAYMLMIQLLF